jgi:hypothetical protein
LFFLGLFGDENAWKPEANEEMYVGVIFEGKSIPISGIAISRDCNPRK